MKLLYKYILALIFLIISFLIDEKIISLVIYIRNALNSSFLDYIMAWLANSISFFVIFILMTSFFLWEERKRNFIPVLWLSFFTALLITHFLKIAIARPRPFINTDLVPLIEKSNPAFPSGHMTAIFSSLPILDKEFPKLKYAWIIFALLIGFSRLYTGVHFLSDLIAGSIIGSLIAYFYLYLQSKYKIFNLKFLTKKN